MWFSSRLCEARWFLRCVMRGQDHVGSGRVSSVLSCRTEGDYGDGRSRYSALGQSSLDLLERGLLESYLSTS